MSDVKLRSGEELHANQSADAQVELPIASRVLARE